MHQATDIISLCLYPHAAANEPVTLHEGPVAIAGGAAGTGRLVLAWLPSAALRLDADLDSLRVPDADVPLDVAVADSTAKVLFSSVNFGSDGSGPFARVSGTVDTFETGTGTNLKAIGFQVVNFHDFLTPGSEPAAVPGALSKSADLCDGGWRIRLTAVPQSRDIFKSLRDSGGYAFTHVGRLERDDGSFFAVRDSESVFDALRWFLCFARGAACAIPVRWGTSGDGAVAWCRWESPVVDAWQSCATWFDKHHGQLLHEIFPAFARCASNECTWPPLRLALHWYQKGNTRAGGMEGSIVLGLTALDLLGALVVVELAQAMSDSKYDRMAQKDKLAALLTVLKVPPDIPAHLVELSAFATANNWTTACEALTELRHGLVHSNKKRRQVALAAPNLATYQAWQLSLWYQELSLLYLLGHKGDYRNRLTAVWSGEVQKVPWCD